MCPLCLATAALIAGSATGTGGITALVAGTFFRKRSQTRFPEQFNAKEVQSGNGSDGSNAEESGFAR